MQRSIEQEPDQQSLPGLRMLLRATMLFANPQPDYHAGRKKNGSQENYQSQKDRAGKTNREGSHEGNKKSARQKKTCSKASEEGSKESDKGHQEANKKNNEEASQQDSEKSREENCEANCKEGAQAIARSFCENPAAGRPPRAIDWDDAAGGDHAVV